MRDKTEEMVVTALLGGGRANLHSIANVERRVADPAGWAALRDEVETVEREAMAGLSFSFRLIIRLRLSLKSNSRYLVAREVMADLPALQGNLEWAATAAGMTRRGVVEEVLEVPMV
jgi:hypothetical protein